MGQRSGRSQRTVIASLRRVIIYFVKLVTHDVIATRTVLLLDTDSWPRHFMEKVESW